MRIHQPVLQNVLTAGTVPARTLIVLFPAALFPAALFLAATAFPPGERQALNAAEPSRWLAATAYAVPKETCPEGEGYFSIIEGLNRRLYIGTHANAVNSWLVEFDSATEKMSVVVDAHQAIGHDIRGFGAQAKIHTRNNRGASGKIYFGTKQGYPNDQEKREDYPGGYPMVYDPDSGQTRVYPIPVRHHGINSITPDESRGIAYVSTCSDHRPGPGENAMFLVLDLQTEKYRPLIDTEHIFGFIVVDHLGRAYHPLLGGDIARYDPRTEKLERLTQTIDGKPPTAESKLALSNPDPINWEISPDGKTLYAQPMSSNLLFAYDLTAEGSILPGRNLGKLIADAKSTDCRAMCVGPSGTAWCAITEVTPDGAHLLHLVRYRPGDSAPADLGTVEVQNPNFTEFVDKEGKPLPFHAGFFQRSDGRTVNRYVILGVCEGRDGHLNIMALHPYTLLRIDAKQLR